MKLNQVLVPFFFGLLGILSFAPFSIKFTIFISYAYLINLILSSKKNSFLKVFSWGFGHWGFGMSWVIVSVYYYGETSIALSLLIYILLIIILSIVFTSPLTLIKPLINYVNISNKYSKILLISALFSVSELTRYYLLNGVPWLIPGNIYLDTISQNIYPIFGVSALSIMIYILCAGYAVNLKKKAQYFLLGLVLISIFPENKTATAQDGVLVSIIQPSSDPFLKYEDNYSYKIESNLDALINKTSKESQLIVIPEAELPYVLNSKRFKSFIENTQKSNKIIMGAWNYDENKLYNVIYSSKYTETYKKKHLVPFGEYIPFFERLRGIIKFFDLPMSNVSKGSNNQKNLNILNNVKVSTPICFDIAFSNTIRKMNKSSLLMINISNDTWFGNSIGPYQHLNLARIRSIENNRWTIRSTNDGISAIISNNGTIVNYLEKGVSDILEDRVSLISNRSFYNKIGYLFIYLFIIMTSLILTIKYIWKKINFS